MKSRIIDSFENISHIASKNRIIAHFNETVQLNLYNTSTRFYRTSSLSDASRVTYKTGYLFAFGFLFAVLLLGIVGRATYSANDTLIHLNYMKYHRNSLERPDSDSKNFDRRTNT
ncbi:hypothetical protein BpHYR1_043176 [Brachionus plicatilis]|uniref:Uncharacterized protein n=1 Tax=Brachionus plicatilis TaxID=10195 RepID=A0A3M7RA76_BRAPC|nr:hypothetical protein BpHYR1_043176 [Brachionus plicatilis]